MNQYNVTKSQQIAIEAESPEDAVRQALDGKGTSPGVSIIVQLRPEKPISVTRPGLVNPTTGVKLNG